MPGPDFFRNLGFFTVEDFLEPELCARLCSQMRSSSSERGTTVSAATGKQIINESIRLVATAGVKGPDERLINHRLESLRPALETHFKICLSAVTAAEFLIY